MALLLAFNINNVSLVLEEPLIMGVLNVTPDSFYDGGRYYGDVNLALEHCARMIEEGASIIDIGGESTRPGSKAITAEEELRRVMPVLEKAVEAFRGTYFSVDTYKAQVAKEVLSAGAHIINDISACRMDECLVSVLAQSECGYVLMHMQGTPQTMQVNPSYDDVVREVFGFLQLRLNFLKQNGIEPARVLIDPGIGFGKRLEDNIRLIAGARELAKLGRPLLYGVSRKSFLGKLLNREVTDRLPGTIATIVLLLMQGVKVLRVHDVAAARDAIRVYLSFKECFSETCEMALC